MAQQAFVDYAQRFEAIVDALLDRNLGMEAVRAELAKPVPAHVTPRGAPQPASRARAVPDWADDPVPSTAFKAKILLRDRYRCRYCGLRLGPSNVHWRLYEALGALMPYHPNKTDAAHWHPLAHAFTAEFEHVYPMSRGGCRSDPRNVVSACFDCARSAKAGRRAKSVATPAEVGMAIRPIAPSDGWVGLTDRIAALAQLPCVVDNPLGSHGQWERVVAAAGRQPFDRQVHDARPDGLTRKEAHEDPLPSAPAPAAA